MYAKSDNFFGNETEMKIDPVVSVVLAAGVVLIGKIVWDWLSKNRTTEGAYMTIEHCDAAREKCCMPSIKKEIGVLGARLQEAEKKLDQGREDFRLLRVDISGIKESLAGIQAVLESALRNQP